MITVYATYHISGTRKLHWLNPRNSWCVQTFTCERHCLIELASMAAADAHPLDSWRSGFCSRLQMSWLWPMLTLGGKVCQGVNSDSGAFMRLGFSSCVCCSYVGIFRICPTRPTLITTQEKWSQTSVAGMEMCFRVESFQVPRHAIALNYHTVCVYFFWIRLSIWQYDTIKYFGS